MTQTKTSQPALSVENLRKSFGAVHILKDVSLSMDKGDFLILVGPSGCGKSTLLNCIAGLEEATSGTIRIAGRDVTREPPRDRDIAMVFQSYALYPTMNVADNIGFGMKIRGMARPVIREQIDKVAKLLQIGHLLDRKPSQLSGGQRQRVAMGRALVREPELFLFDEPLSNLDAKLRVEMRNEIKRLHEATKASIVYVTHDQIEAMTLATRIIVLKDGVIQQEGTPEDIYDRPANIFVADFMGSPPMNLIEAAIAADGSGLVFAGGLSVAVPNLPAILRGKGKVTVGIRPEHVTTQAEAGQTIRVVPDLVENTGAEAYITFRIGDKPLTARIPGRLKVATGEAINLSFDSRHLCYFDSATGALLASAAG